MQCPRCHQLSPSAASYCAYCGCSLRDSARRIELPARAARRPVTVMVADLSGNLSITEGIGAAEAASWVHDARHSAERIIERWGGVVHQHYGDELVALFGLEGDTQGGAIAALRAAFELHAWIKTLPFESIGSGRQLVRYHTGIHLGDGVAGTELELGPYELLGDVLHVATRLRSAAAADEVVVSGAVSELVRDQFECERLPPLPSKGLSDPTPTFRVLGKLVRPTDAGPPVLRPSPFVGRQAELSLLAQALRRISAGHGYAVLISGAPGIGKTRLFSEFMREHRDSDTSFVRIRSSAPDAAPPHYGLKTAVQRLLNLPEDGAAARPAALHALRLLELESASAVILQLLGLAAPADALEGEALARVAVDTVAELFTRACRQRPIALLLEDWQWTDETLRSTVELLGRGLATRRLLIVLSRRAPGYGEDVVRFVDASITLQPLARRHVELLTQELLGGIELPDELTARVHEHTGGNPLFVEEICRDLADAQARGESLHLRETVQAVIRARIDRLDPRDTELLRHAAVLGLEFSPSALEVFGSSPEQVRAGLLRLESAQLIQLEPGECCRFSHATIREVAYDSLDAPERQALHGRVARALEGRAAPEQLAHHYEQLARHYGAAHETERASVFAELAGDKAARAFALEEARFHYRQAILALDASEPNPANLRRRIDVSLRWAEACLFKPAPSQVPFLEMSLEYAQRLGYKAGAARSLYWLGWIAYALGEQEEAVFYCEQALEIARAIGDERLSAQLLVNLGQSYAAATDYTSALRLLGSGITSKRSKTGRGASAALAYSLGYLGLIHGDRGDFHAAYAVLDEALAIVRDQRVRSVEGSLLTQYGMVQLWHGSWAGCLETAERMRQVAERVNGPYILAMSKTLTGYAKFHTGDRASGVELLNDAARWLESYEIKLTLSWNQGCLAEALALSGDEAGARQTAQKALVRAKAWDRLGEVAALRALAIATAGSSEAESQEAFETALARADHKGSPRDLAVTQLYWAESSAQKNYWELAKCWAIEALQAFERLDMPYYAARARQCLTSIESPLPPRPTQTNQPGRPR